MVENIKYHIRILRRTLSQRSKYMVTNLMMHIRSLKDSLTGRFMIKVSKGYKLLSNLDIVLLLCGNENGMNLKKI